MRALIITSLITSLLWHEGEEKTTKKAVVLSLVVPGLGELYMGEKDDALRAFAIEGGIILSYFGLNWYSDILRDDYIKYAYHHAGARTGMDEDYYNAVEWYSSRESHNISVREEARSLFPNEREKQLKYIKDNEIPSELDWRWQENEWQIFRDLRRGERRALSNASYCIGVGIVNRIISAIISARIGKERSINLFFEPQPMGIRLSYEF
jgi:TM2 domain-containing membrane protein YozV